MADVCVYGAGDPASLELRSLLAECGFHVEFRDIRGKSGTDHRALLLAHALPTVPQVFDLDQRHIGDFERTLAALQHLDRSGARAGPADGAPRTFIKP